MSERRFTRLKQSLSQTGTAAKARENVSRELRQSLNATNTIGDDGGGGNYANCIDGKYERLVRGWLEEAKIQAITAAANATTTTTSKRLVSGGGGGEKNEVESNQEEMLPILVTDLDVLTHYSIADDDIQCINECKQNQFPYIRYYGSLDKSSSGKPTSPFAYECIAHYIDTRHLVRWRNADRYFGTVFDTFLADDHHQSLNETTIGGGGSGGGGGVSSNSSQQSIITTTTTASSTTFTELLSPNCTTPHSNITAITTVGANFTTTAQTRRSLLLSLSNRSTVHVFECDLNPSSQQNSTYLDFTTFQGFSHNYAQHSQLVSPQYRLSIQNRLIREGSASVLSLEVESRYHHQYHHQQQQQYNRHSFSPLLASSSSSSVAIATNRHNRHQQKPQHRRHNARHHALQRYRHYHHHQPLRASIVNTTPVFGWLTLSRDDSNCFLTFYNNARRDKILWHIEVCSKVTKLVAPPSVNRQDSSNSTDSTDTTTTTTAPQDANNNPEIGEQSLPTSRSSSSSVVDDDITRNCFRVNKHLIFTDHRYTDDWIKDINSNVGEEFNAVAELKRILTCDNHEISSRLKSNTLLEEINLATAFSNDLFCRTGVNARVKNSIHRIGYLMPNSTFQHTHTPSYYRFMLSIRSFEIQSNDRNRSAMITNLYPNNHHHSSSTTLFNGSSTTTTSSGGSSSSSSSSSSSYDSYFVRIALFDAKHGKVSEEFRFTISADLRSVRASSNAEQNRGYDQRLLCGISRAIFSADLRRCSPSDLYLVLRIERTIHRLVHYCCVPTNTGSGSGGSSSSNANHHHHYNSNHNHHNNNNNKVTQQGIISHHVEPYAWSIRPLFQSSSSLSSSTGGNSSGSGGGGSGGNGSGGDSNNHHSLTITTSGISSTLTTSGSNTSSLSLHSDKSGSSSSTATTTGGGSNNSSLNSSQLSLCTLTGAMNHYSTSIPPLETTPNFGVLFKLDSNRLSDEFIMSNLRSLSQSSDHHHGSKGSGHHHQSRSQTALNGKLEIELTELSPSSMSTGGGIQHTLSSTHQPHTHPQYPFHHHFHNNQLYKSNFNNIQQQQEDIVDIKTSSITNNAQQPQQPIDLLLNSSLFIVVNNNNNGSGSGGVAKNTPSTINGVASRSSSCLSSSSSTTSSLSSSSIINSSICSPILEIQSLRLLPLPYQEYFSLLYIYPQNLKFDSQKVFSKARNLCVTVEIRDSDEVFTPSTGTSSTTSNNKSLPIIFGRPHDQTMFVRSATTAVSRHNVTPDFFEEIKVALPLQYTEKLHILFTFAHVSCKKECTYSVVGYSWLPISPDCMATHAQQIRSSTATSNSNSTSGGGGGNDTSSSSSSSLQPPIHATNQQLSVFATLPNCYLRCQSLGLGKGLSMPEVKLVGKDLFRVSTVLISSVMSRDIDLQQTLSAMIKITRSSRDDTKELSQIISLERSLPKMLRTLSHCQPSELIHFSPVLLQQLFKLLVYAANQELITESFCTILTLVDRFCANDQHPLLNTFIEETFKTSEFCGVHVHDQLMILLNKQCADFLCNCSCDVSNANNAATTTTTTISPSNTGELKFLLQHLWFILRVVIKSMIQYLAQSGRSALVREDRFDTEMVQNVTQFAQKITTIVATFSRAPEVVAANQAFAHFLTRLLSFFDRAIVYNAMSHHLVTLSTRDILMQEHKLTALGILLAHEHYVHYCNPMINHHHSDDDDDCGDQTQQHDDDATICDNNDHGHHHIGRSISCVGDNNSMTTVYKLSTEYCRKHFPLFLLLNEFRNAYGGSSTTVSSSSSMLSSSSSPSSFSTGNTSSFGGSGSGGVSGSGVGASGGSSGGGGTAPSHASSIRHIRQITLSLLRNQLAKHLLDDRWNSSTTSLINNNNVNECYDNTRIDMIKERYRERILSLYLPTLAIILDNTNRLIDSTIVSKDGHYASFGLMTMLVRHHQQQQQQQQHQQSSSSSRPGSNRTSPFSTINEPPSLLQLTQQDGSSSSNNNNNANSSFLHRSTSTEIAGTTTSTTSTTFGSCSLSSFGSLSSALSSITITGGGGGGNKHRRNSSLCQISLAPSQLTTGGHTYGHHRTEKFTTDEVRDLFHCMLAIVQILDLDRMNQLSTRQLRDLFLCLECALNVYEYKPTSKSTVKYSSKYNNTDGLTFGTSGGGTSGVTAGGGTHLSTLSSSSSSASAGVANTQSLSPPPPPPPPSRSRTLPNVLNGFASLHHSSNSYSFTIGSNTNTNTATVSSNNNPNIHLDHHHHQYSLKSVSGTGGSTRGVGVGGVGSGGGTSSGGGNSADEIMTSYILQQQLSIQSALITLRTVHLYLDNDHKPIDTEIVAQILSIYLTLMTLPQSQQVLIQVFDSIRYFVQKFALLLFNSDAFLSPIISKVIKYCNSALTPIRQGASDLLFCLLSTNLRRTRFETIVCVSRLASSDQHGLLYLQSSLNRIELLANAAALANSNNGSGNTGSTMMLQQKRQQQSSLTTGENDGEESMIDEEEEEHEEEHEEEEEEEEEEDSSSILQIVRRIREILKATKQIREECTDQYVAAELRLQLAYSYAKTSRSLLRTWLENLATVHITNQDWAEAAMCLSQVIAILLEQLASRDIELVDGMVNICKVSENIVSTNEQHLQRGSSGGSGGGGGGRVIKPQSDWLENEVSHVSIDVLERLIHQTVELLEKAELYELAPHVLKVIISWYEREYSHMKLATLYRTMSALHSKVQDLNDSGKRLFDTFFRVAFFYPIINNSNNSSSGSGSSSGDVANQQQQYYSKCEYIYKMPKVVSLADMKGRLQAMHPTANFLSSDPDLVNVSSSPSPSSSSTSTQPMPSSDGQQHHQQSSPSIVITHVLPHVETARNAFEKSVGVCQFVYEQRLAAKIAQSVAKQYKRRVILTVSNVFPYFLKRIPVIDRKVVILTPIEVAIDEMQERVHQLEHVINARDVKHLQLILQGSVNVTVNAGPIAYANAFLRQPMQQPQQPPTGSDGVGGDDSLGSIIIGPNGDVTDVGGDSNIADAAATSGGSGGGEYSESQKHLKYLFEHFLDLCEDALRLNEKLIKPNQNEYHQNLKHNFDKLKSELEFLHDPPYTSIPIFDVISGASYA